MLSLPVRVVRVHVHTTIVLLPSDDVLRVPLVSPSPRSVDAPMQLPIQRSRCNQSNVYSAIGSIRAECGLFKPEYDEAVDQGWEPELVKVVDG